MEIIKIIIYGILEGITEWLPISSTGHLILLKELIPLKVSSEFWNLFEVVIQLGAVLAVVVLYFNKLKPKKENIDNWKKIIIACIPAAIIGLLFDEIFEKYFYNKISVALALIIVGLLFIVIEKNNKNNNITEITYKSALLIGLAQIIAAIFPGTSRSGITIICALLLGITREKATEFTFIMSVPVMLGASLLKLIKFGFLFKENEIFILLIGSLSAFITSLFVIKFLLNYIKKHNFTIFGVYRIILGIIILLSII